MQGKINMDLTFCNSEDNFSLDELVMKVADAFEHKAIAELLKLILGLIQEVLLNRIFPVRLHAANVETVNWCSTAGVTAKFARVWASSLCASYG